MVRGREGLWKSTFLPYTFNFWVGFFIIFMGIFGTEKNLMCTLFFGGGSQKVYGLYTQENFGIYGRPLSMKTGQCFISELVAAK